MENHNPDGDNRELIAFIPYQLGFYPQESVVLVGVRGARGEIALIVRTDLADFVDVSTSLVVVDTLVGHLRAEGSDRVHVIYFTEADLQADRSTWPSNIVTAVDSVGMGLGLLGSAEPAWVVTSSGYYASAVRIGTVVQLAGEHWRISSRLRSVPKWCCAVWSRSDVERIFWRCQTLELVHFGMLGELPQGGGNDGSNLARLV